MAAFAEPCAFAARDLEIARCETDECRRQVVDKFAPIADALDVLHDGWWLEVAARLSHELHLHSIENEVRICGTEAPGSRPWAPLCLAIKASRGVERVEFFLSYEPDGSRLVAEDRPALVWPPRTQSPGRAPGSPAT